LFAENGNGNRSLISLVSKRYAVFYHFCFSKRTIYAELVYTLIYIYIYKGCFLKMKKSYIFFSMCGMIFVKRWILCFISLKRHKNVYRYIIDPLL
jgi:hypothetical protein